MTLMDSSASVISVPLSLSRLTEEAALMDLTAASNTFLGKRRLVVPLSTMLLS